MQKKAHTILMSLRAKKTLVGSKIGLLIENCLKIVMRDLNRIEDLLKNLSKEKVMEIQGLGRGL